MSTEMCEVPSTLTQTLLTKSAFDVINVTSSAKSTNFSLGDAFFFRALTL